MATALALCALAAPSAPAAYPGTNGQIAFHRGATISDLDLFRMAADGSAETPLVEVAGYPSAGPQGLILYNRIDETTYITQIFRVPMIGGAETQMTEPPDQHALGVYTPDGERIVLASDRSPSAGIDLWAVDADGNNPVQITTAAADDFEPAMFPSGERIAYQSGAALSPDIFTIGIDGNDIQQLTTAGSSFYPDVAPDGRHIAFQRGFGANSEIWVMNADGSGAKALTAHPGLDGRPVYSPDGTRILFERAVTGPADVEIFSMGIDGEDLTQLTAGPVNSGNPSWAPVAGSTLPPAACADGVDNDGDGRTDSADAGCEDGFDRSEFGGEPGPDGAVDAELSAEKKQKGTKVKATVSCAEGCTVTPTGKAKIGAGKKAESVALSGNEKQVSTGGEANLKLKPKGKRDKKKLEGALDDGNKVKVKVKVEVIELSGDTDTLTAKVKLVPKDKKKS